MSFALLALVCGFQCSYIACIALMLVVFSDELTYFGGLKRLTISQLLDFVSSSIGREIGVLVKRFCAKKKRL